MVARRPPAAPPTRRVGERRAAPRSTLAAMADDAARTLVLDVATRMDGVPGVRAAVDGMLAALGWSAEDREDVGLIVTEIVQNAVEHGSRADGDERVEVRVEADRLHVTLCVEDPGTGRDPNAAVAIDATQPPDLESPRGRGLFLVHRLATTFERRIGAAGGLCVTIARRAGP